MLFCMGLLAWSVGYGQAFDADDFVNDRVYDRLECEITELPIYTYNADTVYTIEIRLRNQSEDRKLLWFRNKEEITGKRFEYYEWRDAYNFIAEYESGNLQIVNVEDFVGEMFGVWIKSLEPQQEFTIFIQSKDKEKVKGVFGLISVLNYVTNSVRGVNDLGYKGDTVVISL